MSFRWFSLFGTIVKTSIILDLYPLYSYNWCEYVLGLLLFCRFVLIVDGVQIAKCYSKCWPPLFFPDHFIHGFFFFSLHILIPWANVSNIQFFVLYRNSIFTFFLELLVNLDALKYVRFKPFLLNNCALNIIYEHLTWSLLPYSKEKEREKKKL